MEPEDDPLDEMEEDPNVKSRKQISAQVKEPLMSAPTRLWHHVDSGVQAPGQKIADFRGGK